MRLNFFQIDFSRLLFVAVILFPSNLFADDIQHLVREANRGEYGIRINAIRKMVAFGPKAEPAIPILRQILEGHGDPHMRATASQALQAIGSKGLQILIEILERGDTPGSDGPVIEAIAVFGPDAAAAVPALTRALEDRSSYIRRLAIEALGAIGPKARQATPKLIEMLPGSNHYSPEFEELCRTLASVSFIEELTPLLESEDQIVRIGAARAIGKMGAKAKSATPALINRLADPEVPYIFAQTLGKIGASATAELEEVIENPLTPSRKRIYAITALGEIGAAASETVPLLVSSLDDLELRLAAIEALGKMEGAAAPAVPRLIQLREVVDHHYVRDQISETLVQIGTPEALRATGLYRIWEAINDAMLATMGLLIVLPGLVFVVPFLLFTFYVFLKKRSASTWGYRPLLIPLIPWTLYSIYETFMQLFWFPTVVAPIRLELVFITPALFGALLIGVIPCLLHHARVFRSYNLRRLGSD